MVLAAGHWTGNRGSPTDDLSSIKEALEKLEITTAEGIPAELYTRICAKLHEEEHEEVQQHKPYKN